MPRSKLVVVGGGIVGLSTAMAAILKDPRRHIIVLEKESRIGRHQTGHNSGVIHSGIYYKPGSLKARFATGGARAMISFCQEHGIPHEVCGKVIVATEPGELPQLKLLYERGRQNGLEVRMLGRSELRELEPHVEGVAAIHVPDAGIVDYSAVARTFARIVEQRGGEIRLDTRVEHIAESQDDVTIETNRGTLRADTLVNCAGLHSDRVAGMGGLRSDFRIVPFRGEYYELVPERRGLVKNLVYPVPNPSFPFLGVHFTRMIDGSVHAGPNAVLSLHREGYRKTAFDRRDAMDALTFAGFWRLARRHYGDGLMEMYRSFSKAAFVRSLQRLIPEIEARDLVPAEAGVRAQALRSDGAMVDDFLILNGGRCVHVCNAPSPAATASIMIGDHIARMVASPRTAECS